MMTLINQIKKRFRSLSLTSSPIASSQRHRSSQYLMILLILILFNAFCIGLCNNGKVRVKIFDHRAYHDPKEMYGSQPWKYFGHGFGIDYGYHPDGSEGHERGYGFIKAFAHENCGHNKKCKNSDPDFWRKTSLKENGFSMEPFYGHPPADVPHPKQQDPDFIVEDDKARAHGQDYFYGYKPQIYQR